MAQIGGLPNHGLQADHFDEDKSLSGLRTFDAFPKTKPSYSLTTRQGGQWTLLFSIISLILATSEIRTWWAGTERHHFTVERGVSHELQLNVDIVVSMQCKDLHVNVLDAAGDRIIAAALLDKHETSWQLWTAQPNKRRRRSRRSAQPLNEHDPVALLAEQADQHVGQLLGHMKRGGKRFPKTPKVWRNDRVDACRIFGSLEGNKIHGDLHITARGHGYFEPGQPHLDHNSFNFSHYINELSFGPHHPTLLNPLDQSLATTETHFNAFRYHLSLVPSIFTQRRVTTKNGVLDPASIPQPATLDLMPVKSAGDHKVAHMANPSSTTDRKSVFTNQYAVNSQSRPVSEFNIPGIFFKYDIEPILLIVAEHRSSLLVLLVRLVNVVSGVLVGGGWLFQLSGWARDLVGRKRKGGIGGVLHGRYASGGIDHRD